MSSTPLIAPPVMHIQYVKAKPSGKLSILLTSRLKYIFKNLLELYMNDKPVERLTRFTSHQLTILALVNEIYCKYYTQLSQVRDDVRIIITRAQAYALWEMCNEYEHHAFGDAEMGNIWMQLHQKLT